MGALCYYGTWITVPAQFVALPCFYSNIKHLVGNRLRINLETQTGYYNSLYMPLLYTSNVANQTGEMYSMFLHM